MYLLEKQLSLASLACPQTLCNQLPLRSQIFVLVYIIKEIIVNICLMKMYVIPLLSLTGGKTSIFACVRS